MKLLLAFGLGACASLPGCGDDAPTGQIGAGAPGDPCMGNVDCRPGSICWNEVCLQEGLLRVSLAWTADSDFDLHVLTPDGAEIYYLNPSDGGGTLDVDDCIVDCANPDGVHVENVFFESAVPHGTFETWAVNYDGRGDGTYTIEVSGEADASFSGALPATQGAEDTRHSFAIE